MGWRALLELLNRLAAWLDAWLRRRRATARQTERDRLEDHPADWYREHFGGVRHNEQSDSAGTDDADSDDSDQSE